VGGRGRPPPWGRTLLGGGAPLREAPRACEPPRMTSDPIPADLCLAALLERGLLMAADLRLPSVTTIVAGKPVSGSWWSDPAGRAIYAAQGALMARPDVL